MQDRIREIVLEQLRESESGVQALDARKDVAFFREKEDQIRGLFEESPVFLDTVISVAEAQQKKASEQPAYINVVINHSRRRTQIILPTSNVNSSVYRTLWQAIKDYPGAKETVNGPYRTIEFKSLASERAERTFEDELKTALGSFYPDIGVVISHGYNINLGESPEVPDYIKEYTEYIEKIGKQAGRLTTSEGEDVSIIRNRLEEAAKVSGKNLVIRQDKGVIYFYEKGTKEIKKSRVRKEGEGIRRVQRYVDVEEDYFEVEITDTEVKYNILRFPREARRLLPGYKVPFYLSEDGNQHKVTVSSARRGTEVGDHSAGNYITGLTSLWRNSQIKPSDRVKIEKSEDQYRISVRKKA